MKDPDAGMFRRPWTAIGRTIAHQDAFIQEFLVETGRQRQLGARKILALAQRADRGDVCFVEYRMSGGAVDLGRCWLIRLTWSGKPEPDGWDGVVQYRDVDDWLGGDYLIDVNTYRG